MTVFYTATPESAIRWIDVNASVAKYSRMYAFGAYPYQYMGHFAGQSQGSYRCTAVDMEEITSMYEYEFAENNPDGPKTILLVIDYPEPLNVEDDRMDYLIIRK